MTILSLAALQSPTFLLNSRTPLVIETSPLCMERHPFYLRYGARLPNSLNSITPLPLSLLSQSTYSDLGTITQHSLCILFHGFLVLVEHCCLFNFNPFLIITILQGFTLLRFSDKRTQPNLKCRNTYYRYRKRSCIVQEYEPVSLSPSCLKTGIRID